jgi:Flp pilus assembly protein TadB
VIKRPDRQTLDRLGITRPRGERANWGEILSTATFVFVLCMVIALTGSPPWSALVVVGITAVALGILYLAGVWPSRTRERDSGLEASTIVDTRVGDEVTRRAAPRRRSSPALLLFVVSAVAVVLVVSAGSQCWGYSPGWGLVAAGLYVPSALVFAFVTRGSGR